MPASVARAYVRTGLDNMRPLRVRWAELRERCLKEIPPGPLQSVGNLPCDESSIDAMTAAIAQAQRQRYAATQPADYDSPQWQAQRDHGTNLKQRYHAAWSNLQQAQRRLSPSSLCHQILEDIPADYQEMPRMIFTGRDDEFPQCRSVTEEIAANKAFEAEVLAIEAKRDAVNTAMANEKRWAELPDITRDLFAAMLKRLVKCEHAADAVRQQNYDGRSTTQRKQRRK